jgi:hypothetical protein
MSVRSSSPPPPPTVYFIRFRTYQTALTLQKSLAEGGSDTDTDTDNYNDALSLLL